MKLLKLTACGMCGMPIGMVFDSEDEHEPSVSKQVGPCCRKESKWILVKLKFSYLMPYQLNNTRQSEFVTRLEAIIGRSVIGR